MLKAGIDLDGVLGNVSNSIINFINGIYGESFTVDDITHYKIEDWFPKMTKQQAKSIFKIPRFYLNMTPYPKAIESINKLKGMGWWIDIVTARDWGCLDVTMDWLHDEGVEFDRLSFVDSDQKVDYSFDERFDIFVEDNPYTVNQLIGVVPLVYLVDAPYNKEVNNGAIRVKDLEEMLNSLMEAKPYE
jgi:uncharacterized HAD superfamily protein